MGEWSAAGTLTTWTREEHESVKREVERGGHLDHEEALRALAEIERLNGRLAHAHDAANKLYRAASLFTSGWDDIAIRQVFAALDLSEQEACAQEAARRDGLEEENARLRREVGVHKGEAATLRARLAQTTEAANAFEAPPAEPRDESIDALRGQYLSHLAAIRRDLDAVVNRMCVPSLDADDWRAINDRISTLRETIGDVAPPATAPLAQALDLLRRTRAVLHKLDPAHERLRGEISTILTSTPIEDLRDIAHPTVDREPIVERVTECPKCATPVKLATTPITQALGLLRRARPWVTADPFDRDSDPARMPSDQVKRLAAEIDALLAGAPVARAVDASLEARALAAFDAWGWGTRRIRPLTEPPIRVDRNAPDTKALWQTIVRAVDASRPEPPRAPLTEEEAAKQSAPDARPVSASSTAGEWQCVSCHAHETEMHRAWCEIEGAAGTVASRATDAQPVAPPTPDLDALRARREELRAKMAGDGGDRSTSPLVALIRELAEIEAQIEATKEGAK